MAIRFDASTDRLTGGGITGTVGTVACWFRVAVDRDNFSNAWALWNSGTTGLEAGFGTTSDGVSFVSFDSGFTTQTGPVVSVGTWYCMALVMNGTSWTLYHGTAPGSLTTVGPDTRAAISSPGGLSVSDPADWINGDIASLKVWSRALSGADVIAELGTYDVVNATSLVRHHRFLTSPGTTSEAGSGGNLTAGSTATATSTGPAALDTLVGDVASAITAGSSVTGTALSPGAATSTVTAGSTVTGAAESPGAATSAITAGSTVTGARADVGATTSTVTAGSSVTGTVLSPGAVTSAITAVSTVTGAAQDPASEGAVTSAITAGATVTGTALSPGSTTSTVTAGSSVAGNVTSPGAVASAVTAGSVVAGIDLTASTVVPPVAVGTVVLAGGARVGTVVLAGGMRPGTVTLAAGIRAEVAE